MGRKVDYWECPNCGRRIKDVEHASAKFDYECVGGPCAERCSNRLSDYVVRLTEEKGDG